MKPKGTERINRCSIETHRLRYSELYGAADSKSHRQVKDVYSNAGTELTKQKCIGHAQKRVRTAVSDLERAIAGLAQFDRRCPPNICLVGHFGAANICSC